MRRRSNQETTGSVHHPLFARFYARMSVAAEYGAGMAAHRAELLAGLSGRVIEIGAGNGLNFAHYPRTVSEVVAVEPEPRLRGLARTAAVRSGVPVDVVPGTAESLPLKSEAFDAAVVSLVLCSVRDPARTCAEIARVLRPGGEVRFLEHHRSDRPGVAAFQRVLDGTVWPLLLGGCHSARDPLGTLRTAGFDIGPYRNLRVPAGGLPLPTSAHVLGRAIRLPDDGPRG
ncbi:class I SAM-dependent methyltransferase [Streptomyces meridianus]|uniref:Class I SAM-dependent methyltransferase n=1 Tax=Streptomyces meridianus TaxID=2938945 RepID=A0ABT0X4A7_9ACTN|nr:class I SAM-dependent methyltransferase [Streptomyces meridianus]MCM2577363.1 class I SAM-dependent methyltransferase [Streptomyces meridianus]